MRAMQMFQPWRRSLPLQATTAAPVPARRRPPLLAQQGGEGEEGKEEE